MTVPAGDRVGGRLSPMAACALNRIWIGRICNGVMNRFHAPGMATAAQRAQGIDVADCPGEFGPVYPPPQKHDVR